MTYAKLHCKGDLYRFSTYLYTQTEIQLPLYKVKFMPCLLYLKGYIFGPSQNNPCLNVGSSKEGKGTGSLNAGGGGGVGQL